jgi:hypothetical protein
VLTVFAATGAPQVVFGPLRVYGRCSAESSNLSRL